MPELIRDGVTGFLVGSVDAAVDAVGRLGSIDRATCRSDAAQRFSASRMVADYERLFAAVAAGEVSPMQLPRG
jgi:glycosyltransferase involved in cell wall biosynthesis